MTNEARPASTDRIRTKLVEDATPHTAVSKRRPTRRTTLRLAVLAILCAGAAGVVSVAGAWVREYRWARSVRQSFTARKFEQSRALLRSWLVARPLSGEAHYYEAWLALKDDRPSDAFNAIQQAKKLGFDEELLQCLTAILQSRVGRFSEAEPILQQAFDRGSEPRPEVARELARIYLQTFRLNQAAKAIERWKALAPTDPRPHMWSNEIASRSNTEPEILIGNYRAALELDPSLDKARLGLAEQLTRARRFAEAESAYRFYLERKPNDAGALVALGRNTFQAGDLESARRQFEAALALDPRQADALKELAHSDLGLGLKAKACERYRLLTEISPYDYEIRYAYSQALRLLGDNARAKEHSDRAARLRVEHQRISALQKNLLTNPDNSAARFEVAKWMLENGHDQEGLNWTKEILRAEPNHNPTHRLLVEYYQKHGEHGLANYYRSRASVGLDDR
jgi:Tfp pilus assembly protein PilF